MGEAFKACRGCLIKQPLSSFCKHSRMADGHLNFCKECVKAKVNDHRQRNLEREQARDRDRHRRNPRARERLRATSARYFADPVKKRASKATSNAIRDGRLIRPNSCSACGRTCKPEAHHDDYNAPLDVRWLCVSCHRRLHRALSLGRDPPF